MSDVYFVYLGKKLPNYAKASLELSLKYSGSSINLIANNEAGKNLRIPSVNFIPVEDFYSEDHFTEAAKRITSVSSFRQGFWHKSLERLFVLEQFMNTTGKERIFHAEIDQLLFRVDHLIDALDKQMLRGLFVPFHNSRSAVASVLFCNDIRSLSSLIDTATKGDVFPNEMVLTSKWASLNPDKAFALPTFADSFAYERGLLNPELRLVSSDEVGGFVDAAQLGQWVGGVDPRNISIRKKPETNFVDPSNGELLAKEQLEELTMRLDSATGRLCARFANANEYPVYNLHIHSKVHPWLLRKEHNLQYLLRQASKSGSAIRIPGTRKAQLKGFVRGYWEAATARPHLIESTVRRNTNLLLRRRPVSYPFISGDGFRKVANHVWEKSRQNLKCENLRPGDIVFCEGNYLENFKAQCLPNVSVPFVLLLGNSDVNYSSSNLGGLAENPNIRIFAQNLLEGVPNVSILPIGLENARWAKNGKKRGFLRGAGAQAPRLSRVMWSFKIETNVVARTACANAMLKSPVADSVSGASPSKHRKLLGEYAFVASPPGNGEDTHRMWEAMYLGCVPIVLRSHMTEEFERLGMPIWIVDDYREPVKLTEEDLAKKYEMFNPKFETRTIWHDFWKERITGASDELAQV